MAGIGFRSGNRATLLTHGEVQGPSARALVEHSAQRGATSLISQDTLHQGYVRQHGEADSRGAEERKENKRVFHFPLSRGLPQTGSQGPLPLKNDRYAYVWPGWMLGLCMRSFLETRGLA